MSVRRVQGIPFSVYEQMDLHSAMHRSVTYYKCSCVTMVALPCDRWHSTSVMWSTTVLNWNVLHNFHWM